MSSFLKFFFILWFVAEIFLMVEIASLWGGLTLFLLIMLSFLIGGLLLRFSGNITLRGLTKEADLQPETLLKLLQDGFYFIIAGLLFILPGFISDIIAVLLMIGPLRRALLAKIMTSSQQKPFQHGQESVIIEGEYIIMPEDENKAASSGDEDCETGPSMIAKEPSTSGENHERE